MGDVEYQNVLFDLLRLRQPKEALEICGLVASESGVGGGISTYHKYMEEALSGMSLPEIEIETTFLDITTSNAVAEPIMTTAAASVHFDTYY